MTPRVAHTGLPLREARKTKVATNVPLVGGLTLRSDTLADVRADSVAVATRRPE